MKDSPKWEESDLIALIQNQVPESLELDYKACASLGNTDRSKNEISKDVSAFANSAGGTIVYGIVENGTLPVQIDTGYDPDMVTKEWLEHVINSRIQRRIDGVIINPVALTTLNPGRVAYVVSIPQSVRAPHMASDHKFYKRFNFESIPMEEYEVRDVSKRYEAPDLFLNIELLGGPSKLAIPLQSQAAPAVAVDLLIQLGNHSPEPAEHILVNVFLDSKLAIQNAIGYEVTNGIDLSWVPGVSWSGISTRLAVNWGGVNKMPVWEGVLFRLTDGQLRIQVPKNTASNIHWSIRTPKMSTKTGLMQISHTGTEIILHKI